MKLIITEQQLKTITESYIDSRGELHDFKLNIFDEFPEKILKTLESNYFNLYGGNFDWNKKQDEFVKDGEFDGKGFGKWLKQNEEIEFKKNLNKIISSVRKDMILKRRQKWAEEKLEKFEDLIKEVFGKKIMAEDLSEFEAAALLFIGFNDDIETQKKRIEQAMRDAKNIIDSEGDVDYSKIRKSDLFKDKITVDSFQKFVEKNPEYKTSFDIWKKLFDESIDLSLKKTIAFHYPSYNELKELYNFLINFRGLKY